MDNEWAHRINIYLETGMGRVGLKDRAAKTLQTIGLIHTVSRSYPWIHGTPALYKTS